jgi:hypothetical protein
MNGNRLFSSRISFAKNASDIAPAGYLDTQNIVRRRYKGRHQIRSELGVANGIA